MRVLLYLTDGSGYKTVIEADFIRQGNAVEPLTIHSPFDSSHDLAVQVYPGQSFVLRDGHLVCDEDGHEVVEEDAEIVFRVPAHAHDPKDCGGCQDVFEIERRP